MYLLVFIRILLVHHAEKILPVQPLTFRGDYPRQELSRTLVDNLHDRLQEERSKPFRHNKVAKAINYMFEKKGRWQAFTAFLGDGRICLTNNAAKRALRGLALGRKSWLFAGSERSRDRAAAMYTLIVTAKMTDIDPQAWLADVLARPPDIRSTVDRLQCHRF